MTILRVKETEEKIKIYLDTTIPNYVYAVHIPEKQLLTIKLFNEIRKGKHRAFVSDIVLGEIQKAEKSLRNKLLKQIKNIEILRPTEEVETLARNYIDNKIISPTYADDARHVAIATINNMDAVISWNYDHLVSLSKVKKINVVNEVMGYKHIEIVTPREVVKL